MTSIDPRRSPLAATPLPELLAALAEMGVPIREASFLESAARAVAASEISDRWLTTQPIEQEDDQQLIREAAIDLWRRWLPDRPCTELLASQLAPLLSRPFNEITPLDLEPLAGAIRAVPGRARDLTTSLSKLLATDVFGWLREVAKHIPEGTSAGTALGGLFPAPLPTPEPQPSTTVERPRPAEGPPNLSVPAEVGAQVPSPATTVSPTQAPPSVSANAGTAPVARKSMTTELPRAGEPALLVGRNEPCPCGSGKKYKRCHLGKPLPAPAGR
jgi:hypothetical protein